MNQRSLYIALIILNLMFSFYRSYCQNIKAIELTYSQTAIRSFVSAENQTTTLPEPVPLFTFFINDTLHSSIEAKAENKTDSMLYSFPSGLSGSLKIIQGTTQGWKAILTFFNNTGKKFRIENLIPFGIAGNRVYITAGGSYDWPYYLNRTRLYRPGYGPVGVVLPDNAWSIGYCDMKITETISLTALARRKNWDRKAEATRWSTTLAAGQWVQYNLYVDSHTGEWQQGLELFFRQRFLYDLEKFDNILFERKDLQWIRHSYIMLLQFAWDKTYFDPATHQYQFDKNLFAKDDLLGGYDIYTIWPTWPRLGLDERNQWDLYRDLPGGIQELQRQVELCHMHGKKYFISYNPWDECTRYEDHIKGLEEMLRSTGADGVVLDTRGASSKEFQEAADRIKPGIIMYSEGMAVPRDMPGIVSGRVHDALYMPPPLNLNKFIKPDFAVFRVIQLAEGRIHREVAISFFNGFGVEINTMRPGRPEWIDEELRYLGRTTKILRENTSVFSHMEWTPLLPTLTDSIWVNRWQYDKKTIYTVFSLKPEGWNKALFEIPQHVNAHYVSLWNHEEIIPDTVNGKSCIHVNIEGFSRSLLGTRGEGNVDCIALLPYQLKIKLHGDSLSFSAEKGDIIRITAGNPVYNSNCVDFPVILKTISLHEYFPGCEEKFVVQLFADNELSDERIVLVPLAFPRLISKPEITPLASVCPEGMVEIKGGKFLYSTLCDVNEQDSFLPYPDFTKPEEIVIKSFFIDKYPVTNRQFKEFLGASNYSPADTSNFLRHLKNKKIPEDLENHPVVYVSLEDARAYAHWAGKRLPSEVEWQYAAQGNDGRKYPWGNEPDTTKCNTGINHTTAVNSFPEGCSPFGVCDLVGNIWQLTNDVYDNGSYYFCMIRGGSWYNPKSSIWYIGGGPKPVNHPQILLLVSPGFDRSSTVGFRCAMDKE
jgi:formylglycine-generating enzyme required for sulfatase activity